MAKEIRSQRDQRVPGGEAFLDQHGRTWVAEVEASTNAPCGPYLPADFEAPWYPPQYYMRFVRGKRGRNEKGQPIRLPYDIEIDYNALMNDWRVGAKEWEENATKRALAKFGDNWDRSKGFPREILIEMGDRPGALFPVVEAAAQGHPYILGKREFDPTKPSDRELQMFLEKRATKSMKNWLADDDAPATETEPAKAPKKAASAA